jgi:hypothetical protein
VSSLKHNLDDRNTVTILNNSYSQLIFLSLDVKNLHEDLLVQPVLRLVLQQDEVLHEMPDVVVQNLK